MNLDLEHNVAEAVLDHFDKLKYRPAHPPGGKRRDWTCMAGIALEDRDRQTFDCVAIGTGLKCLNESSASATTVNDSHAEVICRRSFCCFLYQEIARACGSTSKYVQRVDGSPTFRLGPHVRAHLYISQSPCGDASLDALAEQQADDTEAHAQRTEHKRDQYGHETGALRGRNLFDRLGVLRTKPGRHDAIPTRSMSCSDKIAQWQCLGLQGALLSHLIPEPITFASIIVGDLFDPVGLERALVQRCQPALLTVPHVAPAPYAFDYSARVLGETVPPNVPVVSAPHAMSWWRGCDAPEYLVNGRRQGAAMGKDGTFGPKTWSRISKPRMFELFRSTAAAAGADDLFPRYLDAKEQCTAYRTAKRDLRQHHPVFAHWVGNDAKLVDDLVL
ncbi:hypothetical protein GGF32_008125 [Allomyces javanicus]|nr:hypothetical protein GGF32_008125 [Allomyces javanicus]